MEQNTTNIYSDMGKDKRKDVTRHDEMKATENSDRITSDVTVPLWHKSTLSIDEAVFYTGIGRGTLYKMTDRENCPFVLWIGNKRRIKRRAFDDYIAKSYSV